MARQAEVTDIVLLTTFANELLPNYPTPDFSNIKEANYVCIISDMGGYIFAKIDRWNGKRVAFIISAAAYKNVPDIERKAMSDMLDNWCRDHWISKILTMTPTPEVFLKRWGFKLESFVISRAVSSPEHKK